MFVRELTEQAHACPTTTVGSVEAAWQVLDHWSPVRIHNLLEGVAQDWLPDLVLDEDATQEVTVSETPRAEAIAPLVLRNGTVLQPAQRQMPLAEALALLRRHGRSTNAYLRSVPVEPLTTIRGQIPLPRGFVERLLSSAQLQAANLWLGDGSMRSGLHFDAHDNLLLQMRGSKHVLLLPPDLHQEAGYTHRPARRSIYVDGRFQSSTYDGEDVQNHSPLRVFEDQARHAQAPSRVAARATVCTLERGQALFIPALWSHAVESIPETLEEARALAFDRDGSLPQASPTPLNAAVNLWFVHGTRSFEEALRIAPAFPQAHTCSGDALRTLGRHDEARHAFSAALALQSAPGAPGRTVSQQSERRITGSSSPERQRIRR